MKKYSWIVALLIALSLAFIGCPGDSGGGGDDPNDPNNPNNPDNPGGGDGTVIDIPSTFDLTENAYGDGFQYKLNLNDPIVKDDEFTLKMTFTISRDVVKVGTGEGKIGIGLVDTVTGYWNPLSWSDADDIEMFYTDANLVADTEYTVDTTLKALKSSEAPTTNGGNVIIFQTEHEFAPANNNTTDSGMEKITITCSSIELKKK